MAAICRQLVSPLGRRLSSPVAHMGASAFLGRSSLFSTSGPGPAPAPGGSPSTRFLSKEEFLSTAAVKKLLGDYKTHLIKAHNYGCPSLFQREGELFFDLFHKSFLEDLVKLNLYCPQRVMLKMSYMALYLRCTFDDLDDCFYYLYHQRLEVGMSTGPVILPSIIRLSRLDISHDEAYILRSDASVNQARLSSGYGFLLTNPNGKTPLVGSGNSTMMLSGLAVPSNALVLAAELDAVRIGLDAALRENVRKLKILSDCADVVDLIIGKAVWIDQEEDIMDMMCKIGISLKKLNDYSANHIFRENNLECDYFAAMGRKKFSTNVKDLKLFTAVPKFRLQGTFHYLYSSQPPQPLPPPSHHMYQQPANQPLPTAPAPANPPLPAAPAPAGSTTV